MLIRPDWKKTSLYIKNLAQDPRENKNELSLPLKIIAPLLQEVKSSVYSYSSNNKNSDSRYKEIQQIFFRPRPTRANKQTMYGQLSR